MINRRILIFGLVAILGISIVKLGTNMISDNLSSIDDEIEIIRSDEQVMEIVEDEDMRKTVFYFKNDKDYLVPVMKPIPWEEGIAKTVLMNMVEGAEFGKSLEELGLKPILPAGTDLKGISVDRKSTRLNSSHVSRSYAVFCLKNKSYQVVGKQCYHFPLLLYLPSTHFQQYLLLKHLLQ